jgi:drug/metabolite transporter (DMT)-like permease
MFAPVSLCFIIFNTNPFIISLLGLILNGEPIHRFEIIGIILCFSGLLVLSWSSVSMQSEEGEVGEKIIGILFALASGTFFSVSCVINRKLKNVNFLINSTLHSVVGMTLAVTLRLSLLILLGKPFMLFVYPIDVTLKGLGAGFCDSVAVMSVIVAFMSDSSGFVSLFGYI